MILPLRGAGKTVPARAGAVYSAACADATHDRRSTTEEFGEEAVADLRPVGERVEALAEQIPSHVI